jgi:hypothetical protein
MYNEWSHRTAAKICEKSDTKEKLEAKYVL